MEATMRLVLAGVVLSLAMTTQPTSAWGPIGHDSVLDLARNDLLLAKGDKYKWKAGGCKYEYKADNKGFKEKYKCK
jgi:hypothetical protein